MTTQIDYQAQAREFAQWLVSWTGKGRRRWWNREIVRGNCPKPGHEDKHPSFSYDSSKDAYACSCSSGKGSELMSALGWKSAKPLNGDFVKPAFTQTRPNREPDEVYRYANGNRKLKWRTPGQRSQVAWRHEDGTWGAKGEVGIYCLEEAAALAKGGAVVHIAESESDVDALCDVGFAAIATPHGASSPWKELPSQLAGARLVVWEHQDDPGRKYAAAMVAVAKAAGADAVIARPASPYKDAREWILAGGTLAQLEEVALAALLDFPRAESADELLAAELAPPDYVIEPIAIKSNLTMVQGEPKAGKSVITQYLATCAALGRWEGGRWNVPRPFRTLYITWEDGRRRVQKRLRQFLAGMGEPFQPIEKCPNLFIYSKSKGPFKAPRIRLEEPAGRTLLKKLILGHRAELVILDTFSHVTGVDENSKKDMQPVMDALTDIVEETDCALIFNHHTGKIGKDKGGSATYRSRGSSTIPAAPDVIIHMGDRGKGNVTPVRTISREDDPDSFNLEYLPDGKDLIRFKLVDEEDEGAEDADKYRTQKQIVESLGKLVISQPWGASVTDVTKDTQLSRSTVKRVLERMADESLIQRQKVASNGGPAWHYANVTHTFQAKPEGGSVTA